MSYQFAHLETYSRKSPTSPKNQKEKGKKGAKQKASKINTKQVFDEADRVQGNTPHIQAPEPPTLVYGQSLEATRQEHDQRAETTRQTQKNGVSRGIRNTQATLMTGVLSHPGEVDGWSSDDVQKWEKLSVQWLKNEYGDQLKTVVRHDDESHPHLHFYVIPDNPEMKANELHPGFLAKQEALKNGLSNKDADKKYKEAMKEWQDSYFEKVASKCGLSRLGPGRKRTPRDEHLKNKASKQLEQKEEIERKELFQKQNEAIKNKERILSQKTEQAQKILSELDSKKQELERIKNSISLEEERLTKIKDLWFIKRLLSNIREEGFKEGIKKSSSQISKLKKSISKLKKEKETIQKEKDYSEELRRKDMLISDNSDREKQELKNKVSSLISENDKLKEEKEDYKNKYSDLHNSISLQSSKSGYKK